MYNLTWSSDWTNFAKPVDPDRPFHRVNSPVFSTMRERVDGKGYGCGCHSPNQYSLDVIEGIIDVVAHMVIPILGFIAVAVLNTAFRKAIRSSPNWVPVGRTDLSRFGYQLFRASERNQSEPDREMEIEGVLWRSFQTWTDVPPSQWHKWYDWNFHVVLARGYSFVRGAGNDPDPHATIPDGTQLVGHPESMECEWDCGAFHSMMANLREPGPMFHQHFAVDWAWPMAGQYFWASGRWIYDCGHATSYEVSGPNEGKMRTELHPCKAIATARWEAAKFDENEGKFTPAIQFMFFASKCGGYIDFDDLGTRDYEFIVDLPALDPPSNLYAVGHTPEFPLNTVMLRPRLLHKFDPQHFINAKRNIGQVTPELTVIAGEAGAPPKQAKIKIPMTALRGSGSTSYGMVASLGWFDFDGRLAARVKEVEVIIDRVHMEDDGQYQVKIGVNGRWTVVFKDDVDDDDDIPVGRSVKIHLDLDQTLSIAVHGMEQDAVGRFFNGSEDERRLNGYQWDSDIDQPDLTRTATVARDFIGKQFWTFASENDPIGIIDPGHGSAAFPGDTPNPITVRELLRRAGGVGVPLPCVLTGCKTEEAPGESAELIFKPNEKDYTLHYRVIVREQ